MSTIENDYVLDAFRDWLIQYGKTWEDVYTSDNGGRPFIKFKGEVVPVPEEFEPLV